MFQIDELIYTHGIAVCKPQPSAMEFLVRNFPLGHKVNRPFRYTHSTETNVAKTFERVRREAARTISIALA
jgi:hypothetical protein